MVDSAEDMEKRPGFVVHFDVHISRIDIECGWYQAQFYYINGPLRPGQVFFISSTVLRGGIYPALTW